MEKLKIAYPVIVEGKYDRLRLISVAEAQIITTEGFGIFRKSEKAALIRALAEKSRIIVLTDSDGAGGVIRSRISQLVPRERLIYQSLARHKLRDARTNNAARAVAVCQNNYSAFFGQRSDKRRLLGFSENSKTLGCDYLRLGH